MLLVITRRLLLVLILACGLAQSTLGAVQPNCPADMAKRAEDDASQLNNWQAIYRSFERFKPCDEGSVAEEYSTVVSHMLAKHWERLDVLVPLMNSDEEFANFIFRHIDETMTEDEAYAIIDNSRHRCPATATRLCRMIIDY